MSCHQIGTGLSEIMGKIFTLLYDEGKIPKESMFDLLEIIKSGTYCCDGNIGETMEYVCSNRCIVCLRQTPISDLVCQYALLEHLKSDELSPELKDILKKYKYYCICKDCQKEILSKYNISEDRISELIANSGASEYC